jgi:hypothetical protein
VQAFRVQGLNMQEQFIALIPDPPFVDFLRDCKTDALKISGPQKYLEDEPHLTLGVGDYDLDQDLKREIQQLVPMAPRTLSLDGWHAFADDPVTGGTSLVLKVAPEGAKVLRTLQIKLLESISGKRKKKIPNRYSGVGSFPPSMLQCLEKFGFPFVGEIWEPHFTIASFERSAFLSAWERISAKTPPSSANLVGIAFCQILDKGFITVETWDFGKL